MLDLYFQVKERFPFYLCIPMCQETKLYCHINKLFLTFCDLNYTYTTRNRLSFFQFVKLVPTAIYYITPKCDLINYTHKCNQYRKNI